MKMNEESYLIERNDTVLVVIDVQDLFLERLEERERNPLVQRIAWLMDVAQRLEIPMVVTAEDLPNFGGPCIEIKNRMPGGIAVLNKMVFNLAGDAGCLEAVKNTRRKTAVLVGLETDVCVSQSSLGLLELWYRVVVVTDATGSPGEAHQQGLERLRGTPVILTSVKGLYYEWLRTVKETKMFHARYRKEIGVPDNVLL